MMNLKPQFGAQHQQKLRSSSNRWTVQVGILCLLGAALVSGCVSSGKYEAEKARALNFQRLLAQEEQRAAELDARLQERQQEIVSLGSQNRELRAERDTLQDQISSRQTSAPADDMDISPDMSLSDPSLSEFGLSDFSFDESEFNELGMEKADGGDMSTPTYHTVVKGDTLYRISRTYGVTVDQLKKWNNLTDNIISIGRRLIVSQP